MKRSILAAAVHYALFGMSFAHAEQGVSPVTKAIPAKVESADNLPHSPKPSERFGLYIEGSYIDSFEEVVENLIDHDDRLIALNEGLMAKVEELNTQVNSLQNKFSDLQSDTNRAKWMLTLLSLLFTLAGLTLFFLAYRQHQRVKELKTHIDELLLRIQNTMQGGQGGANAMNTAEWQQSFDNFKSEIRNVLAVSAGMDNTGDALVNQEKSEPVLQEAYPDPQKKHNQSKHANTTQDRITDEVLTRQINQLKTELDTKSDSNFEVDSPSEHIDSSQSKKDKPLVSQVATPESQAAVQMSTHQSSDSSKQVFLTNDNQADLDESVDWQTATSQTETQASRSPNNAMVESSIATEHSTDQEHIPDFYEEDGEVDEDYFMTLEMETKSETERRNLSGGHTVVSLNVADDVLADAAHAAPQQHTVLNEVNRNHEQNETDKQELDVAASKHDPLEQEQQYYLTDTSGQADEGMSVGSLYNKSEHLDDKSEHAVRAEQPETVRSVSHYIDTLQNDDALEEHDSGDMFGMVDESQLDELLDEPNHMAPSYSGPYQNKLTHVDSDHAEDDLIVKETRVSGESGVNAKSKSATDRLSITHPHAFNKSDIDAELSLIDATSQDDLLNNSSKGFDKSSVDMIVTDHAANNTSAASVIDNTLDDFELEGDAQSLQDLYQEATELLEEDKLEQAGNVYARLIDTCLNSASSIFELDDASKEYLAKSLVDKAQIHIALSQPKQALTSFDTLIRHFGEQDGVTVHMVSDAIINASVLELTSSNTISASRIAQGMTHFNQMPKHRLLVEMLEILRLAQRRDVSSEVGALSVSYKLSPAPLNWQPLREWASSLTKEDAKYRVKETLATFQDWL